MASRLTSAALVVLALSLVSLADQRPSGAAESDGMPLARMATAGDLAAAANPIGSHSAPCGDNACCVDCGVCFGSLWATYCMDKECRKARWAIMKGKCHGLVCGQRCSPRCGPRCGRAVAHSRPSGCCTGDCTSSPGRPSPPAAGSAQHIGDPPEVPEPVEPAQLPETPQSEEAPTGDAPASECRPLRRINAVRFRVTSDT